MNQKREMQKKLEQKLEIDLEMDFTDRIAPELRIAVPLPVDSPERFFAYDFRSFLCFLIDNDFIGTVDFIIR